MKLKLKILNIFYLFISVGALIAYVANFSSFLSASFTYKVSEEVLLEANISDQALEDFGISIEDLFSDLDTVVFEVDVNVSSADLIFAWTETTSNYDYVNSKFDAKGRYLTHRILAPAFDNLSDILQEDLTTVAENAVKKMIYNMIVNNMNFYSLDVEGEGNCFYAMEENEANVNGENLNDIQFNGTVQTLYGYLAPYQNSDRFLNGYEIEYDGVAQYNPGLRDEIRPYFEAIHVVKDQDEADLMEYYLNNAAYAVNDCLHWYGLYDESERFISLDEAIGSILQRLINAEDYDDSSYSSCLFVDKLFAPLKGYIDEDNLEFENDLTAVLVNVIAQSNANQSQRGKAGTSGPLFKLFVLLLQVSGILLVLFLLCWIIKFIQAITSFFRSKPYIRMNPVGIVAGVAEALLAIISVATLIIYNNFDMVTLRTKMPSIFGVVPLGLSFSLRFIYIPGILAIVNFLFSLVYGPVKKKFKQESREELLYSNDYNDYE